MGGRFVDRHDVVAGVGMSVALVWLFTVPFCPLQVAAAFPAGCAPVFVDAFMLGCALGCAVPLVPGRPDGGVSRGRALRTACALLPLGFALQVLALGLGLAPAGTWVALCSLVAGLGEAAVLLAWGRALAARPTAGMLGVLAAACAGAALLAAAFGALAFSAAAMRSLMVALAVAAALFAGSPPTRASQAGSDPAPQGPMAEKSAAEKAAPEQVVSAPCASVPCAPAAAPSTPASAPSAPAGLFARLWEPVLGLGLSLMSALLPWGSLMFGSDVSIPVYWSFAAGALLVGAAGLAAARLLPGRVDFDVASHVAIPLLAAAVVALRLVGDLEGASAAFAVAKGIGSGVASAGFLVCAWLAMGREARASASVRPVAWGLGAACLVGFSILPLHAANQSAAALAAPFLSLAFLVVACCSSIFHLRHHAGAQQQAVAAAPGIEEAADELARRYALSPRETQVLHQLVLGRSAEGIGAILGISPNTVRSHVGNIHSKLDIRSRDQLADLIDEARRSLT